MEAKEIDGWGRVSLPEYLNWNTYGKGFGEVVVYHITAIDNLLKILKGGLKSGNASKWFTRGKTRPEAVYFFCSKSVLKSNVKHLLDEGTIPAFVEVKIPSEFCEYIAADNIYNMAIDDAEMTAVKYLDDVPAEWITAVYLSNKEL